MDETHRLGKKVAAHCIGSDGIAAGYAEAGVDTIEHGDGLTDALIDEVVKKGAYWVPTITVGALRGAWTRRQLDQDAVDLEKIAFQKSLKKGVKSCSWHRRGRLRLKELNQAKEFAYYVEYGMTPMQAIRSGTPL